MTTVANLWRTYGKSLIALAFAVYTAVAAAISDGHITTVEWVQIAIAAATAAGVWLVPLHPGAPWAKTAVAVLLAVLNVVASAIVTGWGPDTISTLVLAALTAAGVSVVPARSTVSGPQPVPGQPR